MAAGLPKQKIPVTAKIGGIVSGEFDPSKSYYQALTFVASSAGATLDTTMIPWYASDREQASEYLPHLRQLLDNFFVGRENDTHLDNMLYSATEKLRRVTGTSLVASTVDVDTGTTGITAGTLYEFYTVVFACNDQKYYSCVYSYGENSGNFVSDIGYASLNDNAITPYQDYNATSVVYEGDVGAKGAPGQNRPRLIPVIQMIPLNNGGSTGRI